MDLKNAQKKKSQFFNHSTLQNDAGSPEKKIPNSADFCKRADFTPKENKIFETTNLTKSKSKNIRKKTPQICQALIKRQMQKNQKKKKTKDFAK